MGQKNEIAVRTFHNDFGIKPGRYSEQSTLSNRLATLYNPEDEQSTQTPAITTSGHSTSALFPDRRCAAGLPLALRRNQMEPPQRLPPRMGRLRFQRKRRRRMALVVAEEASTVLLTMERRMQQKYMDFDVPHTL